MKAELEQLLKALQKLLEEILEAQNTLEDDLWWRGQSLSTPTWRLEPLVYRKSRNRFYESSIANIFKSKAPVRYPNCPTSQSEFDWLFLMQHYGLPTRLLDWTESPLIALFFALWEPDYILQPGSLWALSPGKLNELQAGGRRIIPSPSEDKDVKRIAEEAFAGIQHDDANHKILAIQPPHFDTRMLVQQSTCTIHGTRIPLEQLENNREFLWKTEIPPDQKQSLWTLLQRFRIKQSTVFPDIENLAKDLASREYEE